MPVTENQQGADNDQIKFFVEDRQEMTLDKSDTGAGVSNPVTRLHIESNDPIIIILNLLLFPFSDKDTSVRIEGKGETYRDLLMQMQPEII